jgi:hypothetical protein
MVVLGATVVAGADDGTVDAAGADDPVLPLDECLISLT